MDTKHGHSSIIEPSLNRFIDHHSWFSYINIYQKKRAKSIWIFLWISVNLELIIKETSDVIVYLKRTYTYGIIFIQLTSKIYFTRQKLSIAYVHRKNIDNKPDFYHQLFKYICICKKINLLVVFVVVRLSDHLRRVKSVYSVNLYCVNDNDDHNHRPSLCITDEEEEKKNKWTFDDETRQLWTERERKKELYSSNNQSEEREKKKKVPINKLDSTTKQFCKAAII